MSTSRNLFAAAMLIAVAFVSQLSAAPVCDADNGGITLPPGFCALVVADDLGTARHLAVATNGDLYVALQDQGAKGGVVALRDTNGDGKFEMKEHFGSGSFTDKIAVKPSRASSPVVAIFSFFAASSFSMYLLSVRVSAAR